MESALSWKLTNANHHLILSHRILEHPPSKILSTPFRLLSFCHSAIPGNDLADKAAKEATTIATDTILPMSLSIQLSSSN